MAEKTCKKNQIYDKKQGKCVPEKQVSAESYKRGMLGVFLGFIALTALVLYMYFFPDADTRGITDIIGSGQLLVLALMMFGLFMVGWSIFVFFSVRITKGIAALIIIILGAILVVIGFLAIAIPFPASVIIGTIIMVLGGLAIVMGLVIAIIPRPRGYTSIVTATIGLFILFLALFIFISL